MTNQSDRQASVRAITGTALNYEGDWHALFDLAGIAPGSYNSRFLAWINLYLGASYSEINSAMAALAIANGATDFASLGTFDASLSQSTAFSFMGGIPSGWTYTRSDAVSMTRNSTGKFRELAANQVAEDYDFDGTPLGVRFDAISTNKCTNTNWNMTDLTGLTVGGNASASVTVSNHPVWGFPTILIDNTLGGTGTAFVNVNGTFANTNIHSMSTYCYNTNSVKGFLNDSGGSFTTLSVKQNADERIVVENFTPAVTTRTIRLNAPIGGKTHFYLNQLEERISCTFPMKVAGATATRALASYYTPLTNVPTYNETRGSVIAEVVFDLVTNAVNQYAFNINNNGSTAETIGMYAVSSSYGQLRGRFAHATVNLTTNDIHCPIRGRRFPMAITWDSTTITTVAGPMSYQVDTNTGGPTGMNRLYVGSRGAAEPITGWFRSVKVYNRVQTLAQLNADMFPAGRTYLGMLMSGQSNAAGRFRSTETKQNGGEVEAVAQMDIYSPTTENWFLNVAKDGAALDRSNDAASGYTNWFYDRATGNFGPRITYLENVVNAFGRTRLIAACGWDQGATDANDTPANIQSGTLSVFNRIGSLIPSCRFFVCPIARRADQATDNYDNVKQGQRQLVTANPSFIYEAPPQDNVTLGSDNIHLSNTSYADITRNLMRKVFSALSYTVAGAVDSPKLTTNATRVTTMVTVPITLPTGITAMTPISAIAGFRYFDNGTEIAISSATYAAGNVTLTLATTPTSNNQLLEYARGGLYVERLVAANLMRGNDTNGLGLSWNKLTDTTNSGTLVPQY